MSGRLNRRVANRRRRPRRAPAPRDIVPNRVYATTMPREMLIKLVYLDDSQTATTNGLNLDRMFNLNSVFDPQVAAGGHQPRGFDQWAALYSRYRVDRCDVTARFTNAPSDGAICSLLASNDNTAITDLAAIIESPFGTAVPIQLGGPGITIRKSYSLAAIAGVTKQHYIDDDRFQAQISADPTEVIVVHVGFNCKTAFTRDVYTTLEYWVCFSDPVQLSAS